MDFYSILEHCNIPQNEWEMSSVNKYDFKDKVFYDVGAHMGFWTIAALVNGAKMVVAFEPNEIYRLGCTVTLWVDKKSIILVSGLLPNLRSEILKEYRGKWIVVEAIVTSKDHLNEGGRKIRIDDVSEQYPPDIIKIDTEGYEMSVLRGAEETLKKYKPKLMVETHDFMHINRKDEVIDLLKGWGYEEPEAMEHYDISSTAWHVRCL